MPVRALRRSGYAGTLPTCSSHARLLGMMGKKTQFDARNPQVREWSGEVKAYLTIHHVRIEDHMDESAKSVVAIHIRNIKDAYVTENAQYRYDRYPIVPTEDETEDTERSLRSRVNS
eukprot:1157583-Amphidinium_carterae.5